MTDQAITHLLQSVRIIAPNAYELFGKSVQFPDQPGNQHESMLQHLETAAYASLYTRSYLYEQLGRPNLDGRAFVSSLSRANLGTGAWEPGWKIVSLEEDGTVGVTKDDVTFWVQREGIRVSNGEPQRGCFCRVWVAKEIRNLFPGFYVMIGNGDQADRDHPEPMFRLYFHLTAECAPLFVQLVTHHLNALQLPFRAKTLSEPASYIRADGGVIYLERRHVNLVCDAVQAIYTGLAPYLRAETPLFTKQLAPGMGLAEDVKAGQSFGQSRIKLLVKALWQMFLQKITTPSQRLAVLENTFNQADIDLKQPWLEPGSNDIYSFTINNQEDGREQRSKPANA